MALIEKLFKGFAPGLVSFFFFSQVVHSELIFPNMIKSSMLRNIDYNELLVTSDYKYGKEIPPLSLTVDYISQDLTERLKNNLPLYLKPLFKDKTDYNYYFDY